MASRPADLPVVTSTNLLRKPAGPEYFEPEECIEEPGPIQNTMLPSNAYLLLDYVYGEAPKFSLIEIGD